MSLYAELLGADFAQLSPAVRSFHDPHGPTEWTGRANVKRGSSWIAQLTCGLFRFPADGQDIPLALRITPDQGGERWDRNFNGRVMSTWQTTRDGWLIEHLGPIRIFMKPDINAGSLSVVPQRWSLVGLPLPAFLMPTSQNRETDQNGRFHFEVAISAPFAGHIVTYKGWLERST